MNKSILAFLSKNYTKDPHFVDRLLISAYIKNNNISVRKNKFLQSYIIKHIEVNEFVGLENFLNQLEKENVKLDIETLIRLFEFVISPEDRIINGAVYTPLLIRDYIIANTVSKNKDLSSVLIADLSCGCGGFLFNAAKQLKLISKTDYSHIFEKQIFGLDIQPYSVNRSKLLLSLLAIEEGEDKEEFAFNIFLGDALNFNWSNHIKCFNGFDVVIGNPPYVCSRNISESSRVHLQKWTVCSSGHPDLYIPFFEIALENLKDGGVLGYITMNSFFKSLNGRAIRSYFKTKSYSFKIIDFGNKQVFKSRSTYTCICLIEKKTSSNLLYYRLDEIEKLTSNSFSYYPISYINLNSIKGWNLSPSNETIAKIEGTGVPLFEKYKTRNGIATLKNRIYIFRPSKEDNRYYYLLDGNDLYKIEKGITRDIVNPNMLVNQKNISGIMEKVIFPYIVTDTSIEVLIEADIKRRFPFAYEYLSSKKVTLASRDKGKGAKYRPWYMFGRNQSLEKLKYKLFFPHITPQTPNFFIDTNEELLFYNGLAVIGKNKKELLVLKKLMSSRLFWFYISHTSKPYVSSYYSLSRNYIKNFGIADFSESEQDFIIKEKNEVELNKFFEKKYQINLEFSPEAKLSSQKPEIVPLKLIKEIYQ